MILYYKVTVTEDFYILPLLLLYYYHYYYDHLLLPFTTTTPGMNKQTLDFTTVILEADQACPSAILAPSVKAIQSPSAKFTCEMG